MSVIINTSLKNENEGFIYLFIFNGKKKRIKLFRVFKIFRGKRKDRMIKLNICIYEDGIHRLQSFPQKCRGPLQKLV